MQSAVLKGVYLQFAMQVLQDNDMIPLYDDIHDMINAEIEDQLPPGFAAVASWLSTVERMNALHYLIQNPPPKISDITDPRRIGRPRYGNVNTKFFFELYHSS